jgi:hypothetical protein
MPLPKGVTLQASLEDDEDKADLRKLLAEIEAFCERESITHTAFGKLALDGDGHFVRRLRNGTDVRATRIRKARRFMEDYGKPAK